MIVILNVYKVSLRMFFREGWSSAYLSSDSPVKIALGGGGEEIPVFTRDTQNSE